MPATKTIRPRQASSPPPHQSGSLPPASAEGALVNNKFTSLVVPKQPGNARFLPGKRGVCILTNCRNPEPNSGSNEPTRRSQSSIPRQDPSGLGRSGVRNSIHTPRTPAFIKMAVGPGSTGEGTPDALYKSRGNPANQDVKTTRLVRSNSGPFQLSKAIQDSPSFRSAERMRDDPEKRSRKILPPGASVRASRRCRCSRRRNT